MITSYNVTPSAPGHHVPQAAPEPKARPLIDVASITNLSEDALAHVSGVKLDLGCGFSGYLSRGCVEMPHPEHLRSAAKFVAVKEHYDPTLGKQSNDALIKLAQMRIDETQHVLTARHVDAGHVGTQLAHTSLADFMQRTDVTCMDALVMVRDLSLGLESLHAAGFVHGDVQVRKMLVGPSGYLVGDIDGCQEGTKKELCNSHYSKHSDIEDLHAMVGEIFAEVATRQSPEVSPRFEGASFLSDSYQEATVDVQDLIFAELRKRNRDPSDAADQVARFSEAVSSLERGIYDDATLINLAALADDLISAFRSK